MATLLACDGVGPLSCRRFIDRFGSAGRALGATAAELETVERVGRSAAERLLRSVPEARRRATAVLEQAASLGIDVVISGDPAYPDALALIPDAPPMLFVKGWLPGLRPGDADGPALDVGVGIVGSRRATAYGIEQAERFAAALAQHHGLTIVSGGARGVDTAAHRAAMRVGGRTIVVLGCGHAEPYPPENADLFERVCETGGAVISELPPDTQPRRENFPARNRLISGLSLGVLVVEAPRRSGALITARLAVEEHGREALAVPGRVDSEASGGSNALLRSGSAAVALEPADVAEAIDAPRAHLLAGTHSTRFSGNGAISSGADAGGGTPARPERPGAGTLSPAQLTLLDALDEPLTSDELVRRTGLSAAAVRSEATVLELKRLIDRDGPRLRRRS